MPRIMFDLDGVLRSWTDGWRYVWHREFGELPEISPYWKYPVDVAISKGFSRTSAKRLLFDTWAYEIAVASPAYPNAVQIVEELKLGHKIIIATNNYSREARLGVLIWLFEQQLPFDELHFVDKKSEVEADFYIDDKDKNILDLLNNRSSATIVRIDRPWNFPCGIEGAITIHDLAEYVEIINNGQFTNKTDRLFRWARR